MKNYVLQTRAVPESHTGEHVSQLLDEAVKEWRLPVIHGNPPLVTDNASNMVKAAELFGSLRVPCYAHTLNIAVQKCLSVRRANQLLAKIRRIVSFFHRSNIATNILKAKAEVLELPQLKLISDVSTRWNSAYDMLARFLDMQVAIFATLRSKEVGKSTDVSISDEDLVFAEEMIQFLKPLKDVTVMLCSEHNPTVSVIMPLHSQLLNKLLAESESDSPCVREMKSLARTSLQSRYKNVQPVLSMCSALDPRFKMLPYLSDEDKIKVYSDVVIEAVHVNGIKIVKDEPEEDQQVLPSEPPLPSLPTEPGSSTDIPLIPEAKKIKVEPEPTPAKDSVLSEIFGDVYVVAVEPAKPPLALVEAEVQQYKSCPPVALDVHPLQWWKDQALKFPILSRVAKKYLCIPATSVPSERVFSAAGNIISSQRSRLKPKHLDKLIFLKKNMQ